MSKESLGICDAVALTGSGKVDCLELVDACVSRIEKFEPTIKAWATFDADRVRKQANSLDERRRSGKPAGRLHGIPVGIKDIIDTALIPTEFGSSLFSGRLPKTDATLVSRLKAEGAIIMGKTVTAAMATFMPGPTTNPHDPGRTPGGSSSGSAAAVAAFMTPGAVGTQTNGSVIRPASYCGTVGYKPSFGLIPRTGILTQSPFLDQVGVFTRKVEDAALLAEVMMGPDNADRASIAHPVAPPLQRICNGQPPLPPKFGLVRTAIWDQAEKATREGFAELQEALGEQVEIVDLPSSFDAVWDHLKIINEAEMAAWYGAFFDRSPGHFDDRFTGQIQRGRSVSAIDYMAAMYHRERLLGVLDELFDTYDVLLTPAAAGAAPEGLGSTGSPAFCTTWTYCGVPTVSLPLLYDEDSLPIGVQLVGQYLDDGRLLRTARWLHEQMQPVQSST